MLERGCFYRSPLMPMWWKNKWFKIMRRKSEYFRYSVEILKILIILRYLLKIIIFYHSGGMGFQFSHKLISPPPMFALWNVSPNIISWIRLRGARLLINTCRQRWWEGFPPGPPPPPKGHPRYANDRPSWWHQRDHISGGRRGSGRNPLWASIWGTWAAGAKLRPSPRLPAIPGLKKTPPHPPTGKYAVLPLAARVLPPALCRLH